MTGFPAAYVGIPWARPGASRAGCDCWGLVRLVYREQRGVELPDYMGPAAEPEIAEIAAVVAGAAVAPPWIAVPPARAEPLDVLTFRRGPWPSHVGLACAPGMMLHMAARDCAKVERYDRGPWANRLVGAYRYGAG